MAASGLRACANTVVSIAHASRWEGAPKSLSAGVGPLVTTGHVCAFPRGHPRARGGRAISTVGRTSFRNPQPGSWVCERNQLCLGRSKRPKLPGEVASLRRREGTNTGAPSPPEALPAFCVCPCFS